MLQASSSQACLGMAARQGAAQAACTCPCAAQLSMRQQLPGQTSTPALHSLRDQGLLCS